MNWRANAWLEDRYPGRGRITTIMSQNPEPCTNAFRNHLIFKIWEMWEIGNGLSRFSEVQDEILSLIQQELAGG